MSEFENGYYWVSYDGMEPVIMEKDTYGWNAMGIEHEPDMTNYEVLGKVSEWSSSIPQANELLPLVSKQSEPFRCFEIHRPIIPANGCTVQCKECAEKEKQLNGVQHVNKCNSKRIKCATFDKDMQDSIPKKIREKMKADRAKAEKEQMIMDITQMKTEDILAELSRRENVTETDNAVLVFGSIGNDCGTDFVEVFKKIKTPDDLAFLHTYGLRVRMNSHRDYKGFYFKTTDFEKLEKNLNDNNERFAEWVRQNKAIKYMQI